jgi:hypothetical protein
MLKSLARWSVLLLSPGVPGVTGYGLYAYLALPPGASVHPDMKAAFEGHPGRIVAPVVFSALALRSVLSPEIS